MKNRICRIAGLMVLVSPGLACAEIPGAFREYVTYGGFHSIYNALHRVGLSFSDGSYQGLFVAFLAAAITCWLAWGAIGYFRNGSVMGFVYMAFTILVGCMVYFSMIRPTTSMMVYDEMLNLHKEVPEVPEGIALIAGMQNNMTQTITDIVWTSADPEVYDFRQNANGDVFNILRQVYDGKVDISTESGNGRYINASLRRFCEDCVTFELLRPESELNANIFATSADLTTILEAAQNPAVFTVYFSDEFRTGKTMSCTEAYDAIFQDLNGITNISEENMAFWRTKCAAAGYHNEDGAIGTDQIEKCMERATAFLSFITNGNVEPSEVTRNILIARELWTAAATANIEALGDYRIGTSLTGEAIATDRWLPLIKEVMTAVYLGLIPFLLILLPTPLLGRVASLIFGFFCFLTAWEVCDALIHSYAMDHAVNFFDEVRRNGLSFKSITMIENHSHKALMMFGKTRSGTMLLAGVISGVIAKYGGVALAHLAGSLNLSHQGATAANQINDPARQLESLEAYTKTPIPTETHMNQGWNEMVRLTNLSYAGGISGSARLLSDSGDSFNGAADHMAKTTTNRTLEGSARYDAIDSQGEKRGMEAQEARGLMQENQVAQDVARSRMAESLGMERHYDRTSTEMAREDARLRTIAEDGDLAGQQSRMGVMAGTRQRAGLAADQAVGKEGVYEAEFTGSARSSAHNILAGIAAKDILQTGSVSDESRDLLKRMWEHPGLRGHLQTAARMEVSPDAEGAASLSKFFGANGHGLSPSMLEGSQVSFKMSFDPQTGDVTASSIDVATGSGYRNMGSYFERPITPSNPYVLTNISSGETVTLTSGRVYGQMGVYQQAEGFLSDNTPVTMGSADGQSIDRMAVGQRFNGFDSPYVLSRLGVGFDTMLDGVDLTSPVQRAEVIPQIARAVSANFVSSNQSYTDQVASTISAGLGYKKSGSGGGIDASFDRKDVAQFAQNTITQRLMDVTAGAATNDQARASLQSEIRQMTGNNYEGLKSTIDQYQHNHVKEAAQNGVQAVRDGINKLSTDLQKQIDSIGTAREEKP